MTITISDKQARDFALAFVDDIADYIKAHEAEYRAYLLATGQTDENYPVNTEAAE